MLRVAEAGTAPVRGRALRITGAWAWALAGLLVVLGTFTLDPGATRPLPGSGTNVPEDWRGNSGRLPVQQ